MLKLTDNPPVLYPEVPELKGFSDTWWVVRTKSRQEKLLAQNLIQWEIPYFLPMVIKTTRRRGRKYSSLLPLFTGYLFLCGSRDMRTQAMTTNRIAQVLEVGNQETLVADLSQILRAIHAEVPIDPYPYLKVGTRCRVTSGPLAGLEGVLLQKKNVTRLLLQVEILGQAASVEIEPGCLEPIN